MATTRRRKKIQLPPPVPPGGRIAVIAPGSSVRRKALREGMRRIAEWGYTVVAGRHLFDRDGDLAGADRSRAKDLQWALTDPGLDAVWAARGGWGAGRLLEMIDWESVLERPRWLIGFSDLTALMAALLDRGVPSWHAPLVADLANEDRFVARDLQRMLSDPTAMRRWSPGSKNCLFPGKAEGVLAGGCLSLLASLAGTPWQPDLRDKIVFIEEVGEAPYRIDRLLWQARSAGLFRGARGLLFGQFVGCRAMAGRPSRSLARVLTQFSQEMGLPALGGIPAGHGRKARALPLGFAASMDAGEGWVSIQPPHARSQSTRSQSPESK